MPDVTRIIEQKATESIYNDDWVMTDRPTEGEDGGTRKILVSRLKELLCGDYIADEWVAGETYANGAIVSHEGKLYYNKSGGALVQTTFNSNAWLEVKIDELLEKVIGSVGEKWRLVATYHYDDLVVYGGRLYRCIKNTSTQGTWVSNEWIEANAEYYFKKVREYIARYGFVPRREAISSPYNKGDLILYRAPGDTTNNLYMRLNDTEYGDPTWIPENWLNVGNIGGALSKIYDDMEESSCDVQIKEQSIVDENNVADLTSLAAVGSTSGAIATFNDGSDLPMPSLKVAIEPQQDLHGYDAPWVGGAGKNKLENTATTTSRNGLDFTVYPDGSVLVNGTATAPTELVLNTNAVLTEGNYIISGCPEGGTSTTYWLNYKVTINGVSNWRQEYGSGRTENNATIQYVGVYIFNGAVINNLMFYPMIRLSTETDPTFAPYSNICPISGWDEVDVVRTGKNLYGGIDFANSVKDASPRGAIDTTNKTVTYSYGTDSKITIFDTFKPLTSYTFLFKVADCGGKNFSMRIVYTDGTTEGIEILPSDIGNYVRKVSDPNKTVSKLAVMWYQSTLVKLYYDECGIFEGNIQTTDFAPYQGQTYEVSLGSTRYGGVVDVVNGVLTVDRAYVDMGSLTWTYQSAQTVFSTIISGLKRGILICSNYKYTDVNIVERMNDGEIWDKNNAFSTTNVVVKDLRYTDATTFTTAMNGVQLVYELATPQTYQLTPTQVKSLLGQNNVWADTGDVLDAEYIRDMTTIINYLIARIEALENQ